jgi:ADP-ribosyl-[dinitrogen reductase] hydrolase
LNEIDPVAIRDGHAVIGLTFCPGKKHQVMYSGSWDRDLCIDLEAIQAFGAKALVTLMEREELAEINVPADVLESESREYGLEWHHLPISRHNRPVTRCSAPHR